MIDTAEVFLWGRRIGILHQGGTDIVPVFEFYKSIATAVPNKGTSHFFYGCLGIFPPFGELNLSFLQKSGKNRLQFRALFLCNLQHNGDFFDLHGNIVFITDKFIYDLFSFFKRVHFSPSFLL